MKINPNIFRGYDLRGIAGKDLTPEIVEHIGKAYGTFLMRNGIKTAVVGRDCRATSPEYSSAMVEGLLWAGIHVKDIGMNMVGMFYWSQYYLDAKGGVFVTASHNPGEYNGFKFANGLSETLVSDGMSLLRQMAIDDDIVEGEKPGILETVNIREAYFAEVSKSIQIDKPFKVVVDPNNSTAGEIVPAMLRKLGCEVVEKNCNIDPAFPLGTPDPTETVVAERLASEVVESGADLGFSYDADGDRIGIVDEKGNIIWNDTLVAIFAADVLRNHPGSKIMYNTLCSKVVEDTIRSKGGEPFMWRTGHSFLKKKNQEIGAAFIGELSGHFFFSADFYNHDDGFYSTLRLLNYLASTGKALSETVSELPNYISSPEIKLGCPDDEKIAVIAEISEQAKKSFPEAEVIDDQRAGDGVRLNMADSMFVVRYSQNGPYLTIKFEAKTQDEYDRLREYLKQLFLSHENIDWSEGVNTAALS